VVSEATLAQLRALMPPAAVREIYAAVVTDLAKRLDALEAAIARKDAAEVRRIGHTIKGGCAMAGALQAAHLGAQLEAGSDNLDNSARFVGDLRNALGNLERMLKTEFPA
jgi:HPt (histidine-containing phosphotransfer) domain-containing protein